MSRRGVTAMGLWAGLAMTLGCAPPLASQAAAERFWEAVRALDFDAAADFVGTSSAREVEFLIGGRSIEGMRFEDALEDESRSRVPTVLDVEGVPLPLRFDTHLVRGESSGDGDGDTGWRVDLRPTARAARTAELAALFDATAIALGDSAAAIGEAIEAGARDAAKAIEDSLRELESGAGQAGPRPPDPAPPQ